MKLVILDRDGVINYDSDAYIKSPDEWIPIPGSIEAIAALTQAGYTVCVATNQAGLARGLFDESALVAMHAKMHALVARAGGHIDFIAYCPHHPDDGCECRKPKPGLLLQIAARYHVALTGIPFIGDSRKDLEAAAAAGARPVLVRTGNGGRTERDGLTSKVAVFDDLLDAARALVAGDLGNDTALSTYPRVVDCGDSWAAVAARHVADAILDASASVSRCTVMLTGGNTAADLYRQAVLMDAFRATSTLALFGDERCVSPDDPESNYGLVMRTLFRDAVPACCDVRRMEGEDTDVEAAAQRYERYVQQPIDVLMLGVGPDGHIASLFPGSEALEARDRFVVPVVGPKPPPQRLTVTPRVIAAARRVFLLATGTEKGHTLRHILNGATLPASLALRGTWLLDHAAAAALQDEPVTRYPRSDAPNGSS